MKTNIQMSPVAADVGRLVRNFRARWPLASLLTSAATAPVVAAAVRRWIVTAIILLVTFSSTHGSEFRLYSSSDEGLTWERVGKGLPSDARISALYTLGSLALAASDAGLFISQDSARTWTNTLPLPNNARPLTIAARQYDIFVGTEHHGVLLSGADDLQTWHPITNGLGAKTIRCLKVLYGQLHAATDRDGLFALDPISQTWTNTSEGLPPNAQILELANVRGTAFAGLYSQGLYRRIGSDKPWQKIGDKNPLVLAIGLNPGGIYTTDDMGKTFRPWTAPTQLDNPLEPPLTPEAPIWAIAATQRRLIAGAAGGTYISNDHGATWSSAKLDPGQSAIAFHTRGRAILAATTTHEPRK